MVNVCFSTYHEDSDRFRTEFIDSEHMAINNVAEGAQASLSPYGTIRNAVSACLYQDCA